MAITYDVVNNVVTLTTTGNRCSSIYAADKAGTLSIHNRDNISGTDGAPVAVDRALRPADYVMLGGTCNDLYIVIANWTGGMVNATIQVVGIDRCGNAVTTNVVVNGNGTFQITDWYAAITSTQVTVWNGGGGDSFDYDLIQGQWGVSWRNVTSSQYYFTCKFVVGDGVTTSSFVADYRFVDAIRIAPTALPRYGRIIEVKAEGTFQLGECTDAIKKTTYRGITLIGLGAGGLPYFIYSSGTSANVNINLYDSTLKSNGYMTGQATWKIYGCNLSSLLYMTGTIDFFENNCVGNSSLYKPSGWTIEGSFFHDMGYLVECRYGPTATIKDAVVRKANVLFVGRWYSGTTYLINIDTDTWAMNFVESGYDGIVYRQYELDIHVIDESDYSDIQNATVLLKDKDGNTVFSVTTDVNGDIVTQTVSHGYFNEPNGSVEQLYSPFTLTISKDGYRPYKAEIDLDDKSALEISLHKPEHTSSKVFKVIGRQEMKKA